MWCLRTSMLTVMVLPFLAALTTPIARADGNLVPLDGSRSEVQPSDFGYKIEIETRGRHVGIRFTLNSAAAKSFRHADLTLAKSGATVAEATLGLERDPDQGGRMKLTLDPQTIDGGELIIWSEHIAGQPVSPTAAIRNFGGFRVSIAKLLQSLAKGEEKLADAGDRSTVADIEEQWQRWKKARSRGNAYRYAVQYLCECPEFEYGAVIIEVEDDKAVRARFAHSGKELPERGKDLFLRTIDDIFEQLRKEAAEDAHRLDVVYHPQWGYPTYASVDRSAAAKDDEYEMELFLLSPWVIIPGITPETPARHLTGKEQAKEEAGNPDPEGLEAKNKILRAEITRLNLQLLNSYDMLLRLDPSNRGIKVEAAVLASRLAPDHPGNLIVWRVLVATETVKDGLSLADAEKLLGPPTTKSDEHVEWYFNPHGRHVAPYLRAKVTGEGLADWTLGRR